MPEMLTRVRGYAEEHGGGAVGAGIVLVLLPSMVLIIMMDKFNGNPNFGYPILAIFGIMILLGALALVSTLFARLKLAAPSEALALPPGSIRATIALALIVLFALLSVMLYQSLSGPEKVVLKGLSEAARQQLLADPANTEIRVVPVACPAASATPAASAPVAPRSSADPCANGALFKFDVEIGHAVSTPAVDFAKQLLTLIGTLMTSVVSFYFAAKSTETVANKMMEGLKTKADGVADGTVATGSSSIAGGADMDDHEHGGITVPTEDKDLPAATGGVEAEPAQPAPAPL